jgi:hypothetical protein
MNQHFKRVLLAVSMMLAITNVTLGQTQGQTPIPKKAKLKAIIYPAPKMVGVGYVYKKQFVENQEVTFLELPYGVNIAFSSYISEKDGIFYIDNYHKKELLPLSSLDTIASGIYFTKNDTAYMKGFAYSYYSGSFGGKSLKRGLFQISHTVDSFEIIDVDVDIDYYQGIISSGNRRGKYPITVQKSSDNYTLKIDLENGILEIEDISPDMVKKYGVAFEDLIKSSQDVKLTYKNGNVFVGIVDTSDFTPKKGEYKFKTGEIYTGTIGVTRIGYDEDISDRLIYCDNRIRIPDRGKTVFTDGSVADGNWLDQYGFYREDWEYIYENSDFSLTKIRDMVVDLQKKRKIQQQERKIAKERAEQEELREKQKRKKSLIAKYGNHWGELIYNKEYTPGMTQEMVGEIVNKNWFTVSKSIRSNQSIEIWEYSKERMQMAMLADATKGKEDSNGASTLFAAMFLSEASGIVKLAVPQMLVFTNNKLTDIYK